MFEGIKFRHEQFNPNLFEIIAEKKGNGVGVLQYSIPLRIGDKYSLESIEASEKERGLGAELLRIFVQTIGPNQLVDGSIIHEGTVNWLARNGFYNGVAPNFSRTFTNPQTLNRFPFIRFLRQAGVELVSVTTTYNYKDFTRGDISFPYRTSFVAKTQSK